MAKRTVEIPVSDSLRGKGPGVPAGKATHVVRVMHRECVTRSTKERRLLRKHAFAVVEYRGTRPVRVWGATDDARIARKLACDVASTFDRNGDWASVRELSTCRAITKKAATLTRQELHVADIVRVRECRVCGSKDRSKLCKPKAASLTDRVDASESRARIVSASAHDDTPTNPNIMTRWTKAQEKQWA